MKGASRWFQTLPLTWRRRGWLQNAPSDRFLRHLGGLHGANLATFIWVLRNFGDLNFCSAALMLRGSWTRALVHERTLIPPCGSA
jgi:hypothetical protein